MKRYYPLHFQSMYRRTLCSQLHVGSSNGVDQIFLAVMAGADSLFPRLYLLSSHFSGVHSDCITFMSYANALASFDRVLE
jgi:hypothetical protein